MRLARVAKSAGGAIAGRGRRRCALSDAAAGAGRSATNSANTSRRPAAIGSTDTYVPRLLPSGCCVRNAWLQSSLNQITAVSPLAGSPNSNHQYPMSGWSNNADVTRRPIEVSVFQKCVAKMGQACARLKHRRPIQLCVSALRQQGRRRRNRTLGFPAEPVCVPTPSAFDTT